MTKIRRTQLPSRAPLRVLLVALTLLLAVVAAAPAEEAEEDMAFMIAKGRVTYRVYCINCHGATGLGDGTLAELLTVRPTNLVTLSQRNENEFPDEMTRKSIDGREAVRGHGMKEMPVWGDVFQTSSQTVSGANDEGEKRAQRKIAELVHYLRSIQVEE